MQHLSIKFFLKFDLIFLQILDNNEDENPICAFHCSSVLIFGVMQTNIKARCLVVSCTILSLAISDMILAGHSLYILHSYGP